MSANRTKEKVIVFSCSWNAHSSLENAGKKRMAYSTAVVPIRLSCIGRISPGLILKAYEDGASGVCLLGCPDDECRYQTGNEQAEEVFKETRELLGLLGYTPETLQYRQLPAGEGESFLEIVENLLKVIAENQDRS
jgi:F420-non-reducing hydrogenase iron-sulfur subunit